MNRTTILYAITIYAVALGFGVYLKTAHGREHYAGEGGFAVSSAPGFIAGRVSEPGKPCKDYLTACEKSCAPRDGLYRFHCLGPGFNPDLPRYLCQCGDDAFHPQVVQAEPKPAIGEKKATK